MRRLFLMFFLILTIQTCGQVKLGQVDVLPNLDDEVRIATQKNISGAWTWRALTKNSLQSSDWALSGTITTSGIFNGLANSQWLVPLNTTFVSSVTPRRLDVRLKEGGGDDEYYLRLHYGLSIDTLMSHRFLRNHIQSKDIRDGAISLSNLSSSVIDYINSAGGGSITNYPDEVTLTSFNSGGIDYLKIKDGGVGTTQLANASVDDSKLSDNSVSEIKIQNFAVTANKIGSGAVTESKLAINSVANNRIQDGAVTSDKLADTLNNNFVYNGSHVHEVGAAVRYKPNEVGIANGVITYNPGTSVFHSLYAGAGQTNIENITGSQAHGQLLIIQNAPTSIYAIVLYNARFGDDSNIFLRNDYERGTLMPGHSVMLIQLEGIWYEIGYQGT